MSKKLSMLLVGALSFLLLTSPVYAAEGKVATREFDLKTENPDYSLYTIENIGEGELADIPETIENGFFTVKRVTDIQITLLSEEGAEEPVEVIYEDLLEKQLPDGSETYKAEDGSLLPLMEDKTKWEENEREKATGSLTLKGYDQEPEFPDTKEITVTTEDGEQIITMGKLQSVSLAGQSYSKSFAVTGKFIGDREVEYYDLEGTLIPSNPASPEFQGYESVILKHFGLSSDRYKITGGSWTTDYITEDGSTVRYAQFTGQRLTNDWIGYYIEDDQIEGSSSRLSYKATAYYGKEASPVYNVHLTVEYGKTEVIIARVVAVSAAFIILAVVLVLIIWTLRKRKKEEKEGGAA